MQAKRISVSLFIIFIFALNLIGGCGSKSDSPSVAEWHYPASLSDNISPVGSNTSYPQAAMDDKGNAIIVWQQSDGTSSHILKSEYRNGAWTNPGFSDKINPGDGGNSPQLAMDNNGNAIIIWREGWSDIYKSEYRNGVWTNPSDINDKINANTTGPCDVICQIYRMVYGPNHQVAMDNNGNAIIVWSNFDDNHIKIFKSEYRNGTWHHPASLSDNISPDDLGSTYPPDNGGAYFPRVAMDDNGNAIIVWYQYDGANMQIFKSEYRNGVWHHPASLSDNISPDGQSVFNPRVAMDNNGNAVIVWYESDGTNSQIFKSEYRNGTWHHPASLSDNISPDEQDASNPQVAMDNNGNAIIVWEQNNGTYDSMSGRLIRQIFKSEYRNGAWHHPASLSDNISPDVVISLIPSLINYSLDPQVAMDDNGNAIIVWREYNGLISHIFKSEYRNGAWVFPADLDDNISPDGEDAINHQVTMGNNGNAIIVWSQSDGTYSRIFKSEYR